MIFGTKIIITHTFDSLLTACSVLCDVNNILALSQSATRIKPSFEYFISCLISSSDTKDGLYSEAAPAAGRADPNSDLICCNAKRSTVNLSNFCKGLSYVSH